MLCWQSGRAKGVPAPKTESALRCFLVFLLQAEERQKYYLTEMVHARHYMVRDGGELTKFSEITKHEVTNGGLSLDD